MFQLWFGRVLILVLPAMVVYTLYAVIYGGWHIVTAGHILFTAPIGFKLARDCLRAGKEAQVKKQIAGILGVSVDDLRVIKEGE